MDRSRAGIEMDFTFGKRQPPKTSNPEAPMRVLVLGDFGGHATRDELRHVADLRPQKVDIDSLPSLLAKIAPQIRIRLGSEAPFTVAIRDFDDFHPDQLFSSLDFFKPMRELRRQLQDPKTFAQAAALVGSVATSPGPVDVAAHGQDLERLLGRAPTAETPTSRSVVDDLVRQAVASHVVAKSDPRQAEVLAGVDGMTGELMRAVLHDPGFQAVEAAWRGLDRLVRALNLDETLQLFVLDISRAEMAADFAAAPNLSDSGLYGILVDRVGDKPWSLVADTNAYARGRADAALLARLGTLAQQVEAAVVAGMDLSAASRPFASLEDERAWAALRNGTAATSIALAAPSVLLRLPYGKGGEPVEKFTFAEQSTPAALDRYLWGSSALLVAQLVAGAYSQAGGWDFAPGDESVVDDLPTYITKVDGESVQTPCAQDWLPESRIDALLKEGVIPIVSARGRGEIRVARFQSIASPPAALSGRWRND
jgi:type VI secretion system protein ImpC